MFLSLFRAIKFSIQDIYRNIWLSIVTIIILVLALFSVNLLLVVKVIGNSTIEAVKEKIDVSIFLSNEATEDEILALKAKISNLAQVKEVQYISKADALKIFQEKYKTSPEILESLRELGKNPLTPTLVIKPKNIDNLDELITNLNKIDDDIISSRNFTTYKTMLNKINAITNKVSEAGLMLSSIFIFITLLVVYNSIRVAIYTHKREISIMRLVGASNRFIHLPFIFSSVFYTMAGLLITMLIFYPFLSLLQPYLEAFFVSYDVDILGYFTNNALHIFGLEFLGALLINMVASLIAVRKYADV